MKVEQFSIGIISTNCYLVCNEETKEIVIIDPGACPKYLLSHIKTEGYIPQAILLTHGHFDHIMGIDGFLEQYEIPVYVYEEEQALIADSRLNESSVYGSGYAYTKAISIKDGEILNIAGIEFQVLYTPGHTSGCCCYYVAEAHTVFSGDTLFYGSVGRTDFPTSNTADIYKSIQEKLFILPEDTIVYPGHMGATTIGNEKK
ncbi:MAG: MBL fold metallo-hydrolase [Lachnospiraceae bacterium]